MIKKLRYIVKNFFGLNINIKKKKKKNENKITFKEKKFIIFIKKLDF
jgi:hypothetical protein